MSGQARERIFLYGTLRSGGSRDVRVNYAGVEFLGAARVRGLLYDFGDYPGLRLSEEGVWVRGELFDVTSAVLAQLDEWEGIDPDFPGRGEYCRVRMSVEREDGGRESCWGYEIASRACTGRPIISSGDWIAHTAKKPGE